MDLEFVLHLFLLSQYLKLLEETAFRGRKGDFLYMLLVGGALLTLTAFIGGMLPHMADSFAKNKFLSNSLIFMLASLCQIVAIKQLDQNAVQGTGEFLEEVVALSHVQHPNLVNLIGYCADGRQKILVYDYLSNGSLEDHLFEVSEKRPPLDWHTRMKITKGAAQGLEYLHDTTNTPIVYRNFKASSILLDDEFNAKLTDFGVSKLGLTGEKDHVSMALMETYGYCAPEYMQTGEPTSKSDVYSFGVVLLEILSGRKAIDTTRPTEEQNLVSWAQPIFKDRKKFRLIADPLLKDKYPVKGLYQALAMAAMCLQEEPNTRPMIADVATTLEYMLTENFENNDIISMSGR